MSGYVRKILTDAKTALAADIANVNAQIDTLNKQIAESNADMAELDSFIAQLPPEPDQTEAQPA
jgi:peptidoglycan hydrolase CwlO-like protein